MSIMFRTIRLVEGRVHVVTKDGDKTLSIHLFDSVEDAQAFVDQSEHRDARVPFPAREQEYRARAS